MKRVLAGAVCATVAGLGLLAVSRAASLEREYQALLDRADRARLAGDTFRAVDAYTAAAALRPESMVVYLRRGEVYHARRDLDGATRDFRRSAGLDPAAPRPVEALGDVLYERGWFAQAAEAYETRLQIDDRAPSVAYKLALARYRHGSFGQALDGLDASADLLARSAEAHYLRGLCLRELGRFPEAIEALERSADLAPGLLAVREELADLYGSLGRAGEQLEQLQVLAALDRTRIERQVAIALAHARTARDARDAGSRQRHADMAVLTLGEALERAPDEPLPYAALGQVWLDIAVARDDRVALSKALEALERAAAASAATSATLHLYGQALLRDGRDEEAERALQLAVRRYPVEPAALLSYARLAERRQHPHAARTALIEYGALAPDDPAFPQHAAAIARLSLRLGEPAAAIPWFERAAAGAGDAGVVAQLADAQIRAGRIDDARDTIARGLAAHPAFAPLQALARRAR